MIQAWLPARSADVSYGLLLLLGLPVVRDGVFITVPGLTIEVAPECSGLRSAVVLIGIGALVGHRALRAWWTRAIMLALLVALAIVKMACGSRPSHCSPRMLILRGSQANYTSKEGLSFSP